MKKKIIEQPHEINKLIDIFKDALEDNHEIFDAFGYFKIVINGKLDYPDSIETIQDAIKSI